MIIAVRAVFITFFINSHIFPKSFFAFLAHERHLRRFSKWMRFDFSMTFSTIKPLFAARSTDGHLRVQDVFAMKKKEISHSTKWDAMPMKTVTKNTYETLTTSFLVVRLTQFVVFFVCVGLTSWHNM
jgi:hypothetical protein